MQITQHLLIGVQEDVKGVTISCALLSAHGDIVDRGRNEDTPRGEIGEIDLTMGRQMYRQMIETDNH